jgi:phospholipid N-methyltransferase
MPYSANTLDSLTQGLIQILNPQSILDIGAGAGKYGRMVRAILPNSHITAVEIDEGYVEEFFLRNLYNEVIVADATTLIENPRVCYDLVIIGDCIEHLRKSAALDLLEFLVYRSRNILVVYPYKFVQDDVDGHMQEAHISVWGPSDFEYLNGESCTVETEEGWSHHLTLIPGFIPSPLKVQALTPKSAIVEVQLGG